MAAKRLAPVRDEVPGESAPVVPIVEKPIVKTVSDAFGTMEVTVSRSFKINMANYEAMDFFAALKVTVERDAELELIAEELGDKLDTLQHNDMELARNLTGFKGSLAHAFAPED